MDFHPLQIVFEAEDPDSLFWEKAMATGNHLCKGLLFGFGLKNALFGNWEFSHGSGSLDMPSQRYRKELDAFFAQSSLSISTDLVPKGRCFFDIPRFGAVFGDETAEKYGKERAIIERKYRGKEVVEVTLNQLFRRTAP